METLLVRLGDWAPPMRADAKRARQLTFGRLLPAVLHSHLRLHRRDRSLPRWWE